LVAGLGLVPRSVEMAASVVGGNPEALRADMDRLRRLGYRQIVLPARPNADRRTLPALIAGAGDSFAIDFGAAYRMADLKVLQALDGLGAAWLGQPFPHWELADHRRLCGYLDTPVALGGAQFTRTRGIPARIASTALTPLGASADLAVAAHPGYGLPADLSLAAAPDGTPAMPPTQDGTVLPSTSPGVGWTPDPEWLARVTTRHAVLQGS
jgi:O-succinylbenzoate synthase